MQEAVKECVTLVPFKSSLLTYFCFGEVQVHPTIDHATSEKINDGRIANTKN